MKYKYIFIFLFTFFSVHYSFDFQSKKQRGTFFLNNVRDQLIKTNKKVSIIPPLFNVCVFLCGSLKVWSTVAVWRERRQCLMARRWFWKRQTGICWTFSGCGGATVSASYACRCGWRKLWRNSWGKPHIWMPSLWFSLMVAAWHAHSFVLNVLHETVGGWL